MSVAFRSYCFAVHQLCDLGEILNFSGPHFLNVLHIEDDCANLTESS